MRTKSKCGSTFFSTSSTTLAVLPARMSLSERRIASTSSVTRFASTSGAASCARDGAGASNAVASSAIANFSVMRFSMLLSRSSLAALPLDGGLALGDGLAVAATLAVAAAFRGFAVEKLPDELLQHYRRLREPERLAFLDHRAVATRLQAYVLLSEQAGGQDGHGSVPREGVTLVDLERDPREELLVVERDVVHPAHHHARALHGRTHLEAPDIVELGMHGIGL